MVDYPDSKFKSAKLDVPQIGHYGTKTNKVLELQMTIRPVKEQDFPQWLCMRQALYPECTPEELQQEIELIYYKKSIVGELDYGIWVDEQADGKLSGFIEVSIRPEIQDCETSPVGYIESLYVDREFRRQGIASRLLNQAENWVQQNKLSILYVDTDLPYAAARALYADFGFERLLDKDPELLFRKRC